MARSGKDVKDLVSESLLMGGRLGKAVFEVSDDHGIVTLKGVIESEHYKLAAEALVRQQEGVVKVINKLRVPRF